MPAAGKMARTRTRLRPLIWRPASQPRLASPSFGRTNPSPDPNPNPNPNPRLAFIWQDQPNRAELVQYERRFRELYQQVASKLEETKKYFNLYNTLEERKTYLGKEVLPHPHATASPRHRTRCPGEYH